MKRLAFSIIALGLFCSCSYTTYETTYVGTITNYIGTITILDNYGNTVKRWDNIMLKNEVNGHTSMDSFKSFGLNFYDPESKQCIILSNAVPYIIEYNTHTKVEEYNTHTKVEELNTTDTKNEDRAKFLEERDKLISQYSELKELKTAYKKELSKLDKNSEEYDKTKELIKTTKDKMKEIYQTLCNKYNYYL